MTEKQQNELDKIESKVLCAFFGDTVIPEKTSIALRMMGINPNFYIKRFENIMNPIMDDDGLIDGTMLKKVIHYSRFSDIEKIFTIPDGKFLLSDFSKTILTNILPGIINESI